MTKEQLEKQLEECKSLWSNYSCDCLAFEMNAIEEKLKQHKNFKSYNMKNKPDFPELVIIILVIIIITALWWVQNH